MPRRRLIDSHVHLFDHHSVSYAWMGDRSRKLLKPHLPQDLLKRSLSVDIEGMVFIEAHPDRGQFLQEAQFAQDLIAREPSVVAIIADATIERGVLVEEDLRALMRLPGIRGIRRFPDAKPERVLEQQFIEGVGAVGRSGLLYELGLRHLALPYALELVRRCPEVTFVLNHMALPDIANDLRQPWFGLMQEMGALPNVVCKISGAIAGANPHRWSADDILPYIRHAIACFGYSRCMFGSDWPVSDITHDYDVWVELVELASQDASELDREALFRGNAIHYYRLEGH